MLKTIYNLYIKRAQLKIDIGENNNMIVEKNLKKVFTKEESNIIMRKDYDPLNKDCKKSYEGEGLFMKETKDVVLDEEMKKLIISKEDFKKYFDERKIICKKEYEEYLKQKNNT